MQSFTQNQLILGMTFALGLILSVTQSWAVAFGFVASITLMGLIKALEKQKQNELELMRADLKRVEDRVNGIAITRGIGR